MNNNSNESMKNMSERLAAKRELKKALKEITFKHFCQRSSQGSLFFKGISDPTKNLNAYKLELTDLISYIVNEEKTCDKYLQQYCPVFHKELEKSRTVSWENRNHPQVKKAEDKIKSTVKNIDNYASRKSKPVAKDYQANIYNPIDNLRKYGLGHPWGTEIRQRIAHAVNLSNEVDDLFSLGLNSIAHSASVNLGESFIAKIKDDSKIQRMIQKIEKSIMEEFSTRNLYISTIKQLYTDFIIRGKQDVQLGGERSQDAMLKQFGYHLLNPIGGISKYKDTWKVGLNSLTWTIKSCNVVYIVSCHVVYNIYGYSFFWEGEFSIEDTLDLRPASGNKIDFSGQGRNRAYNIISSILGTIYHDLCGNSDTMLVRVKWYDHGSGNNQIFPWK